MVVARFRAVRLGARAADADPISFFRSINEHLEKVMRL